MSVKIELIAQKNNGGQHWDISSICEQIDITWSLEGNAGAMDISCVEDRNVTLEEGDVVSLKVDGKQFFYGWIFKVDRSAYSSTKYKVFDIKRYLVYKDVDVMGNETINQFFERVCKMMKINYIISGTSNYILPSKLHDGETYNNMLQYALDQNFIGTGKRFCIRANGPKLELIDCEQNKLDMIIGDRSLLLDYQYSSDIENTHTAFKVQRELSSEEQKKVSGAKLITTRKTLTHQDQTNIKRWGVLQYYEKLDAKWTDSQMAQHLELLKRVYNRKTKKLKIECLGDVSAIPGNMLTLFISDLENDNVAQRTYSLITEARHTITHKDHHMSLDMEIN